MAAPIHPLDKNLLLVNTVRCFILFAVLALVSAGYFFNATSISIFTTLLTLSFYTGLTVYTFRRLSKQTSISEREFFYHLGADITVLTILFIFSGGSANPFVSLYLFPIIVSASLLSSTYTRTLLLLGITCYSALFVIDMLWPGDNSVHDSHGATSMTGHSNMTDHSSHNTNQKTSEDSMFSLHLYGMWFTFAFSALLISTFVVRMKKQLAKQQQKINAQRESALRDEQVIAIATQAANVAHHIGTPLSTISVIANDLKQEPQLTAYIDDLDILSSQVDLCRNELQQLRIDTDKNHQQLTSHIQVRQHLQDITDELTLLHPQTNIKLDLSKCPQDLGIRADQGLKLAILSLLNNACEASPNQIDISVGQQNEQLSIQIRDYGTGIPQTLEGVPQQPTQSTKSTGLGLGLFLSHATVERQGGAVRLINISDNPEDSSAKTKGTLTEITLPLDRS
ncbi:sensor histidine kinase [Alkalimarinus sediminis]|uniref:histidine kinase n=1 Tax=Alkalimarinus sediminis TaxID=1632866 RepID=A0A9E8HGM9_9ALTE|nr:HAMP domain-containing sensor histidine kinase [Alkalimarinus sediminis]UZW73870.1 ATP-binding protein [Alkalimarinus sediminis]